MNVETAVAVAEPEDAATINPVRPGNAHHSEELPYQTVRGEMLIAVFDNRTGSSE